MRVERDNNIVMALVMRSPSVPALLTGEFFQVNNGKLAKYEPVALAWPGLVVVVVVSY